MARQYINLAIPIPSRSFPIHLSSLILPFGAVWSEILRASLKEKYKRQNTAANIVIIKTYHEHFIVTELFKIIPRKSHDSKIHTIGPQSKKVKLSL
jgi:hypothetical protein